MEVIFLYVRIGMLNWIWGIMITAGTAYGIVTGNTASVGEAIMEGAAEAVSLAITMAGVLGLWCGLMEIAGRSGLLRAVTRLMQPFIRFLFPDIPVHHKAFEYISINFVANLFGLSGAATPSGIKAMQHLSELEEKKLCDSGKCGKVSRASREMCTFLVINVSSLQLIPINMVAYRSQYGSVSPSAVTVPAIIATLASTVTAVIFCKVMCKMRK